MIERIRIASLALILVILLGTVGYVLIEGWSFFEAFYMTIITITTTGFAEVKPLQHVEARVLTIFLIIVGVSTIAYIGGSAAQIFIEAQLFGRRKVMKLVDELEDHQILCGFGRLGRLICEDLAEMKIPFLVIEKNKEKIDEISKLGYLFVEGDATRDEILLTAGIKRAKGLVTVLATDAENVFTTLSAKELNPDIFAVSRAIEDETEIKLIRAGANRIVKPYEIGASRMVHLLTRPGVVDFIDIVSRKRGIDLSLEEIMVNSDSPLNNQSLGESAFRQNLNIIIVAIYRADGQFIYNPTSSATIQKGDRLIAIGQSEDLIKLTQLCGQKEIVS